MTFIDEAGALQAIQRLLRSTAEAKIAVAFWGRGAVETLGLDRAGLAVNVVCNLDSGACNPQEIRKLQALGSHIRVRSDPRLHGKVYWTPRAVVIGSSNASTNGLAVEADALAGWAEANVLSEDPKIVEAARAWFEARCEAAYDVTAEDLARAELLWKTRAGSASPGMPLRTDLIEAFRNSKEHPAWAHVKLALWSEDLSRAGKRALKEEPQGNPALRGHDAYEGWHDELNGGDWLLDFEIDGDGVAFNGYWFVPDPKLETELLTYIREQPALLLPGFGALRLASGDLRHVKESALALVRHAMGPSAVNAVVPLPAAVAFLDGRRAAKGTATPDLAAFERAMRGIYEEAAKIGYRPREFMRMIDQIGALPTAKRLIASATPSTGFTRLWELNRLDLTVEALALSEPWRGLFLSTELDRARRRLKQFQ
jgi:hypothetical protein